MSSSLSSLVDNSAVDNFNKDRESKNVFSYGYEKCEIKLDYMRFKDNYMLFKCFNCNAWFRRKFNSDLINKLKNAYEFL